MSYLRHLKRQLTTKSCQEKEKDVDGNFSKQILPNTTTGNLFVWFLIRSDCRRWLNVRACAEFVCDDERLQSLIIWAASPWWLARLMHLLDAFNITHCLVSTPMLTCTSWQTHYWNGHMICFIHYLSRIFTWLWYHPSLSSLSLDNPRSKIRVTEFIWLQIGLVTDVTHFPVNFPVSLCLY